MEQEQKITPAHFMQAFASVLLKFASHNSAII